jgi:hypothetical protein
MKVAGPNDYFYVISIITSSVFSQVRGVRIHTLAVLILHVSATYFLDFGTVLTCVVFFIFHFISLYFIMELTNGFYITI